MNMVCTTKTECVSVCNECFDKDKFAYRHTGAYTKKPCYYCQLEGAK